MQQSSDRSRGVAELLILIPAFVGLALLLIHLNKPLVGYFASYHAVCAMMAQFMLHEGWSGIFFPKGNLIFAGKPGLIMLNYPLCSFFASIGARLGGDLVVWGRAVSIFFTAASFGVFYKIAVSELEPKARLLSCLLFFLSPLLLINGYGFQNESIALFFLLSAFCLLRSGKFGAGSVVCAALCFSLCVLCRLHFIFIYPAIAWLVYSALENRRAALIRLFLFTCIFCAPIAVWYAHTYVVMQNNENIWSSLFVQTQVGKIFPSPLLLDADFYKKSVETLFMTVTPLFFPFILVGFFLRQEMRQNYYWNIWLICGLVGFLIIPQKLYDHPFYAVSLIPPCAYFAGKAYVFFIARSSYGANMFGRRIAGFVICSVFVFFVARYYYGPAFNRLPEESGLLETSAFVKANTSTESRVIVEHGTNAAAPLFYFDRLGWSFTSDAERYEKVPAYWIAESFNKFGSEERFKMIEAWQSAESWLEHLRNQGANYFVTTSSAQTASNGPFWHYLNQNYKKISDDSDMYAVFALAE